MPDKLTIAFIGNGKSTNRYHAPFVLTRNDKIRIKKIYARNLQKKDWARIDGVEYTDDLDSVLHDDEIQCIVVTTPHNHHYDYAKMVLEAGKNCVCEKPFMETSAEAEELFALAKEKGLMLQCYQNRRFDGDFLTVQKVIESGKLGDLLELEMHFDYYRPEIPERVDFFDPAFSYLYGHGCHTLDQVISYFGKPDRVHYDVRQLLGEGRMNDYFDLDLYYGVLKVSVKSSYFRVRQRPSFIIYGKKGMFEKYAKDKQEADLKKFYLPLGHPDFGKDLPEEYGTLIYYDEAGDYHEEKVETVQGDYGRYYDALYETLINGKEVLVKPEETLLQLRMLETGVKDLK
ncbi:MAG: Gfo/Idh/MocA family oxidoreductase [Solobacterium sp.]|nr:Gfo/Idh/MocA family oxidoreductase [Solobacterium sp.]